MEAPSTRELSDLALDLAVEVGKLDALVESRLQSFYTGFERCLLQISRVLNGGTLDGGDWHRRLLERMGHPTQSRSRSCCAFASLCGICMPMSCNLNLWSDCGPSPLLSGPMCAGS